MIERFSVAEMSALRNELLEGGLDSWQAAELLQIIRIRPLRVVDVVCGDDAVCGRQQVVDDETAVLVRPRPSRHAPQITIAGETVREYEHR